ncbi:phage antirepressor N-terminal domain-containing protein [Propionibacterium freudenreichii]|uniref:phage antirepressor N-terminal domain-containing protein n=1 Tax=Propionibacterium freudenreichii TaxID=1744 RepID=UPI000BC2CE7F|nr:phage antirepressor N-terminal domain-containing protein [Propionibacterium freudenreichii]MDK9341383.1 phage antirepressor [Propionibacterium freudenreichii]SCQ72897.1 Putative prophage antirepressor protein [Propionibacterium freudenreichii]SCQ81389.1 Putative prophage antirepressor protein [Propionibacterium freudenreichii]
MNLVRIPFYGTTINAVQTDDGPRIALKSVCESLGLQWEAQHKRLQRQPWAGMSITDIPSAGGEQRTTTVDRRTFTMWLATISTSRLKSDAARDLLAKFQIEAADVLDRYFHEGGAINPRASEHQVNALILQARMQMELCQAAKGLIRPEHLEARARVVLARGLGEHAELDPADRPLYAQDFLKAKNLSNEKLRSIAGAFGKRLKAAYITSHGEPPKKYPLNVSNGQVREVNAYTEADRPLMEQVWTRYYDPQGVLAA